MIMEKMEIVEKMKKRWIGFFLVIVLPTYAQTTQPAVPTTGPADNPVEAILDRMEKAGNGVKDLQACLTQENYQIIPDVRTTKLGVIRYRAGQGAAKPSRFMVFYDTTIEDDLKLRQKEWVWFDGRWLREVRERTRAVIDRELVAPDEKVDPYKLGDGPFPLPFGQKKADIQKNFNVSLAAADKGDPANSDHLILIPKPGSKHVKKHERLDFWIDRKLNLPTRIVDRDRHSTVITVNFKDIKINAGIADSLLWVEAPDKDYSYTKEPLP